MASAKELDEKITKAKERLSELESQKKSLARSHITTVATEVFDELAKLCRVERAAPVTISDPNVLYHNVHSCLQFGRGPKGYDFVRMECTNGWSIALVADEHDGTASFKIFTSKDAKPVVLNGGFKTTPEQAFKAWEKFEELTGAENADSLMRTLADKIVGHDYFRHVGCSITSTIRKPKVKITETYSF